MVYKLSNTEFKTKKEIESFYKIFLKNEYLHKEINRGDKDILLDLFTNHIGWEHKKELVGDNINILVRLSKEYNTYGFYLRGDKGEIDISIVKTLKALNSKKTVQQLKVQDHKENITRAMRYEINDQTKAFREEQKQQGVITHDKHVDHVIFFRDILDNFLKKNNIKIEDIEIIDCDEHYEIKDQSIKQSWKNYHKDIAVYQMLPSKENLRRKPIRK